MLWKCKTKELISLTPQTKWEGMFAKKRKKKNLLFGRQLNEWLFSEMETTEIASSEFSATNGFDIRDLNIVFNICLRFLPTTTLVRFFFAWEHLSADRIGREEIVRKIEKKMKPETTTTTMADFVARGDLTNYPLFYASCFFCQANKTNSLQYCNRWTTPRQIQNEDKRAGYGSINRKLMFVWYISII